MLAVASESTRSTKDTGGRGRWEGACHRVYLGLCCVKLDKPKAVEVFLDGVLVVTKGDSII